jgi:succinoglycan biosynthesis transport protein ExoP
MAEEGLLEKALRIIRRRKWVVLQATIAVPLIALLISIGQQKQYTATATLLFRQAPAALGTAAGGVVVDPTREAATNGELVALPIVSAKAAQLLDHRFTAGEILASIAVTPSTAGDTATISATTPSPSRSATFANAYGRAYISFRKRADRGQVEGAIKLTEARLADLTPAERRGPEGRVLNRQLDQLSSIQALQTGGAELVQPAIPPSSPSSPHPARNVILGIMLGALLGFGIAALLEQADRRVRTVDEIEELFGLPILARIPRSRMLARTWPTAAEKRKAPESEAFRVLRANLRYFNVDGGLQSILVLSQEQGAGKSTIARNLAMTMAEMGDSVVLVDADLRIPNGRDGLSSVLAGVTPLSKYVAEIDASSLRQMEHRAAEVLPSGPAPPNPSELLESAQMRTVLSKLQEDFDTVILDSPALGGVSDALALVPEASGVVVVSGVGKTTRDGARNLMKQLALLKTQPIGVVANFAEMEHDAYQYYIRGAATRP